MQHVNIIDDSDHDLPIMTSGSQYIAWAIGPRATEQGLGNLAFFHSEYPRNGMAVCCVNSVLPYMTIINSYHL